MISGDLNRTFEYKRTSCRRIFIYSIVFYKTYFGKSSIVVGADNIFTLFIIMSEAHKLLFYLQQYTKEFAKVYS